MCRAAICNDGFPCETERFTDKSRANPFVRATAAVVLADYGERHRGRRVLSSCRFLFRSQGCIPKLFSNHPEELVLRLPFDPREVTTIPEQDEAEVLHD